VARGGLDIFNPHTARGRVGWEVARALAAVGGFRLLRRADPPPRAIRAALAPHLPPRSTYALARANHPERFIALVVGETGAAHAVVKLATDEAGRSALAREVEVLESRARLLAPPLSAPGVVAYESGVLVLAPVPWRPRRRPWLLPDEVAHALGAFFAATAGEALEGRAGFAHGDFAPWNLLRTDDGWVVVDWEAAWDGAPPFFDLFHYVVQAHWLLRRPHAGELLEGVGGKGPLGRTISAYAAGAGLDPADARAELERYLHATSVGDQAGWIRPDGVGLRRRLLHELTGR
jgi:hypothetical protein